MFSDTLLEDGLITSSGIDSGAFFGNNVFLPILKAIFKTKIDNELCHVI